jgi:hypothetical protein
VWDASLQAMVSKEKSKFEDLVGMGKALLPGHDGHVVFVSRSDYQAVRVLSQPSFVEVVLGQEKILPMFACVFKK